MMRPQKVVMDQEYFVTFVISLILFTSATSTSGNLESLVVHCPCGSIQGRLLTDASNNRFVAFRGVPYAKKPVGDLRFAKPQPHPQFESTFDARNPGSSCLIPDVVLNGDQQGNEDCLTLSVFTQLERKSPKKVLVFVHGGGFIMGTSSIYIPGSFVNQQNIIVVTVNYRLGILGFLSTEDEICPGNFGLWDLVLALKWVKANIQAFGGNPDDVTIAGESAGGCAVSYLSLSAHSQSLFTKVYAHSGTATSTFAKSIDTLASTMNLAKTVGCWNGDVKVKLSISESQSLLKCLRQVSVSNFTQFSGFSLDKTQFVPRIDGDFIPDDPVKLLSDQSYLETISFLDKSHLIGINNNEKTIMEMHIKMNQMMVTLNTNGTEEDKMYRISALHESIQKFYFDSRLPIDQSAHHMRSHITDWYKKQYGGRSLPEMISDLSFLVPSFDHIDAAAGSPNVWLVYFNHYPEFIAGEVKGMHHGMDLLYWFDFPLEEAEKFLKTGVHGEMTDEDLNLKKMFSSLLADFVKNGNPNDSLMGILQTGWPSYNARELSYLDFAPIPSVKYGFEKEKHDLWRKVKDDRKHSEL